MSLMATALTALCRLLSVLSAAATHLVTDTSLMADPKPTATTVLMAVIMVVRHSTLAATTCLET